METEMIRVGITQGDTNSVGYELILKAFADQSLCDLCVPIVYGDKSVALYHRKALQSNTSFVEIQNASEAKEGSLNLISCQDGEIPVELGVPTTESGKAAAQALKRALKDWRNGDIDVLVTCPIAKNNIFGEEFPYIGHTDFLEKEVGTCEEEALMMLMNSKMKVALATAHLAIKDIPTALSEDLIIRKTEILDKSLKQDFTISIPRIAVLSLNPHNGDEGLLGKEEQNVIIPAIKKIRDKGIQCFGPYSADGFFGSGQYVHFDAILAMYHDQGLAPLKALSMSDGVNFTAGLSIVRTSPDHGTAFDIAGKGQADENSLRQAIYTAIDVFRNRGRLEEASVNPLKIVPQERDSKTYASRQNQNRQQIE